MWQKLKTMKKPIVLYGMGNGADKILAELHSREIPVAGIFASDGFVRGHSYAGFQVLSYSQAKERWGDMCVLLCFGSQRPEVMETIKRIAAEQELYAPDVPVIGEGLFTPEYVEAHRNELHQAENCLADDLSRQAFRGVTEYKLTGRIEPLLQCETSPEEAWRNILRPGREESYLDLGAYTGDTVREFIACAGEYRRIFAVEPDPRTFAKLVRNTAALHDCVCFRLGVHSTYAQMNFAARAGRNSSLGGEGILTEMDSIDHILTGRQVTYIKMDVEGQEAAAIEGARETLLRWKPKMLVSAYHRTEDLWDLPLRVLSIRPDYRVYLRHYPYLPAWDTNYYFI